MNHRPLPTVIGPTENALRSLLHKTLHGSPIGNYAQWVAMNYADREPLGATEFTVRVAEELKDSPENTYREVRQLVSDGLLQASAAGYTLTQSGQKALREGRKLVRSATSRLTDGVAELDVEATVRTLDRIRANAERELARQDHASILDRDANRTKPIPNHNAG